MPSGLPSKELIEALEAASGTPIVVKVRESNPGLPTFSGSAPSPLPPGLGLSRVEIIRFKTVVLE